MSIIANPPNKAQTPIYSEGGKYVGYVPDRIFYLRLPRPSIAFDASSLHDADLAPVTVLPAEETKHEGSIRHEQ
jgi:hypothetical protein